MRAVGWGAKYNFAFLLFGLPNILFLSIHLQLLIGTVIWFLQYNNGQVLPTGRS
jgi:hypothetical protein